jgi:hypothetical protein
MTRRGRPSGKVPFFAVYVAARANGMATYMAGRSALILLRSVAPITNASLTADINIASTINYVSQDRPDKNVEHLIAHAEEVMHHAAGADYLWVVNSATHFGSLCQCITTPDQTAGADISLRGLVALGWRDVLVRIWHRLEPALQSNLPPFDSALRPATKKRIADQ